MGEHNEEVLAAVGATVSDEVNGKQRGMAPLPTPPKRKPKKA